MGRATPRAALSVALLLMAGATVAPAWAEPPPRPQSPEYDVKAAYLLNFAKFVEWPADAFEAVDEPLRLCVYGNDPFEDALAAIDGKSIGERRLAAEQVRRLPLIDGCHILFIPRREFRLAGELLDRVGDRSVLTVTENEDDDQPRGIINLVRRNGRIVFQITPAIAERNGLRISSRLLQLAEVLPTAGDRSRDDAGAGVPR